MGFIVIYVTYPSLRDARLVTTHLLERKLVACSNVFPISSFFWWNGNISEEGEYVSLLKTKKENWPLVYAEIVKLHPHDVPAIIKLDVEANGEYEKWIVEETVQE